MPFLMSPEFKFNQKYPLRWHQRHRQDVSGHLLGSAEFFSGFKPSCASGMRGEPPAGFGDTVNPDVSPVSLCVPRNLGELPSYYLVFT